MQIDNSAASAFRECPLKFWESYCAEGTGLELKTNLNEVTPLEVGSRVHELLEEYYRELRGDPILLYPESPNGPLEIEAQLIINAYKAKYPQEEFQVEDVERTFKVALPRYCKVCYRGIPHLVKEGITGALLWYCDTCNEFVEGPGDHIYTGKIDVTFRESGKLNIMDHKTEKRRSNSNHPKKWAARDQASLYLWAASKIYQEEVGNFYVNVLKRPSDKLQEGPIFPDRQRLERTPEQIAIAVRDLVFIADEIERYKSIFSNNLWPSNREECSSGWGECDFYQVHTYGWSQELRDIKFQPKTPYLHLENIEVIRGL